MKFMITFTHVEGDLAQRVPRWGELTPDEVAQLRSQHETFAKALESEKHTRMVYLDTPAKAKTVRMHQDGRLEVTDGPYVESSEQAGGFFIIEADSMEEAVEWAKKGRWLEMAGLIDDGLLEQIAVVGEPDEIASKLRARCEKFADRISLVAPTVSDPATWLNVVRELKRS